MSNYLIIGASSGIGQTFTRQLADSGHTVYATYYKHPMKKIGTAKNIADMANFLISDEAGWITGQIVHVDGGMSSIK